MTQTQNGKQKQERFYQILDEVKDPEIPVISIVEMGMVHQITVEERIIWIQVMPTFLGCPALEMIERSIRERMLEEPDMDEVFVEFIRDPLWSSERITPIGREKLAGFGLATPSIDRLDQVECPYCQSSGTNLVNLFGSTACRSIYYCRSCKEPFEAMKPI
ncbi:ring-1,2-phenylacetyl-CoA epoxidase subunit PaaD [Thermoactinomyces sp. DSM 45891]|uniref:1,2-phenylacetyl-CoA epoxidase subunit PaaD n=1 Tax=Thermoactinomyces sp. DSM 45891 TaxID=1761907 RepID=UPI00091D1EE1|nr:1,2-phenylacetyl-CoA epoxidase subunit PaaD [Thermoactinomyces sp. DSM 45891]SFX57831.1 ring-1,2-phenylacetyl-CoA epoxidase subunit PaaD [Thermoactinomyces sp. DSM 45891]